MRTLLFWKKIIGQMIQFYRHFLVSHTVIFIAVGTNLVELAPELPDSSINS